MSRIPFLRPTLLSYWRSWKLSSTLTTRMTTGPAPSVSKAHPTIARTIEIFWHQKAKRPQAVWDCDHLSRKAKDVAKRRWMASLSVSLALWLLLPASLAFFVFWGMFQVVAHLSGSSTATCYRAQLGLAFPNIPMNSSSEASGNDVMLNGKLWTWTGAQAGTIGNMVNFKNDQRKKLHKKDVHAIS